MAVYLLRMPFDRARRERGRRPLFLEREDRLTASACAPFGDRQVHLQRDDERAAVAVAPRLAVSELDLLHAAVAGGVGLALLPAYKCVDDVRAKRLERVLRDWQTPPTPIHVVYPSTRHVSPAVKSFIDHPLAQMTPPPWELGPLP